MEIRINVEEELERIGKTDANKVSNIDYYKFMFLKKLKESLSQSGKETKQ